MRRPRYLQRTHEALEDWASWRITHPYGLSLLGKLTVDTTAVRTSTRAHCLVPHDLPPRLIGRVDQALSDPEIPRRHLETIVTVYLAEREQGRAVPRRAHDLALEYMAGRLR